MIINRSIFSNFDLENENLILLVMKRITMAISSTKLLASNIYRVFIYRTFQISVMTLTASWPLCMQFNSLYYKLNYINMHLLSFMFQSYCRTFFGLELWHRKICFRSCCHKLSVVYHRSFKRTCKMNSWEAIMKNRHSSTSENIV